MTKRTKIKKERITFELPLEDLKKIDAFAEKTNRNRSDMIRTFIGMGLEDAQVLESMGFLTALKFGLNIFDKFKDALKNGDVKVKDGFANFPLED
jgi:hypothetical protein